MWDMKKEVKPVEVVGATKIVKLENLSEAVMVVTDHVWDEVYGCETEADRIELVIELVEEFFQTWIDEDTAEFLLKLARAGEVVELDGEEYPCFTVIPNSHYEFVIDGKSYNYWGSLEDLESLDQLEDIKE